ncbi:hypothetical protein M426DRAFT_323078 [Hypoxylon sp. CI-4A]|nr:hypothetical protein M426DRAFT_323078 [Hypoxylon sp. CI-4A]
MDFLQHKTLQTSRGFTYSYYISNPASSKPTLLFHHGFPDDALIWKGVAQRLTKYRLVVPNLLGYSGTSKPTDPAAYSTASIARDIVDILDAEEIDKVISIGHDWGSIFAQRLYNHHPDRVEGLILLNVAYIVPPKAPGNLKLLNAHFEKVLGFPIFGYQEFFITDEAPALLKAHLDRFYEAVHGAEPGWTQKIWCSRENLRNLLLDETQEVELLEYAKDPELRRTFVERFQRDGFEGPLCYYKASSAQIHYHADKDLEDDRLVVKVPLLFIGCEHDPICRKEAIGPAKEKGFLPDLEEIILDSRHWCPLEKPEEVAAAMASFLEKRFGSK